MAAGPPVERKRKKDDHCILPSSAEVHEDYDCMLSQTAIGKNNNKFYVIQVLTLSQEHETWYYVWTRWGRVGAKGQSSTMRFDNAESAIKEFEKKYFKKTKNKWSDRENFVAHHGSHSLIDRKVESVDGEASRAEQYQPCTLDEATQTLIALIYSNRDFARMPLGELSGNQITAGIQVLEQIEAHLNQGFNAARLTALSSNFYKLVPHNFGQKRPTPIDTLETVEQKKDILKILADAKSQEGKVETIPHPLDQYYASLKCQLTLMGRNSANFEIIEKYLTQTADTNYETKIVNVWEVDRELEGDRFSQHDELENRRLLWHGTKIAKVAAILKSGLRIRPHSGGRVGRGIYFASESTSLAAYGAAYASGCPAKNTCLMFLCEVALGEEWIITKGDSLNEAPAGHNSVVVRGRQEPDPAEDTVITLGNKEVAVPQGRPIAQPQYSESEFESSEYVIFKESQCRLRFLLELNIKE